MVGVGHCAAQGGPVVAVDLAQIIGAADGGALVEADLVGDGDAVGEEIGDGRGVEALDVIAFEEGVDDELPVGGDVVGAALVEMEAGQAECVEVGGEGAGVGEIGGGVAGEPDQAAGLERGELDQAVRALVEAGEAFRARQGG